MRKRRLPIDLPDVNVLVALFDPAHVHHEIAHEWFSAARHRAWATCPLTQSGFLRVVTNPAYPNRRLTVAEAASYLSQLIANHPETHHFFRDDTSLLDSSRFDLGVISGHRQVSDLHLVGICTRFKARLITLDKGISALTHALVRDSAEILLLVP
jgi:toxin-antitoxin system PIN domain toxin